MSPRRKFRLQPFAAKLRDFFKEAKINRLYSGGHVHSPHQENQKPLFLHHPLVGIAVLVLVASTLAIAVRGDTQSSQGQESKNQATTETATPRHSFVIRNARIFDGERLTSADSVFVQNGKIKTIGKNLQVPPGTAEMDATGDTLLPGLIDSHTHDWGDSPMQALLFGVTTELNMSGPPKYVAELKQAEAEGKRLDSADMLSAGNPVTPPKGHGTEYGVPVPTISSAAEAQQFVDARIAEGSDYIKIILEDGRLCHFEFTKLPTEVLAAAIAAAHKRGKMAIVHISTEEDARAAIAAGADGIAHLFADAMPQPDFAQFMRRHHAFAITTLTTMQTSFGTPNGASLVTDKHLAEFLSPDAQSHLKSSMSSTCTGKMENALAAAKQLHHAGVPILAGTDAPSPGDWNGASMHGELELLVRAGLSSTDALAAATSVPAKTFHLSDRGRIAEGLRADLLLVRGDPTRDITTTRDIVAVWKVGVQDERKAYRMDAAK
jgi:imidazolonepropionase-like amidohydrolase